LALVDEGNAFAGFASAPLMVLAFVLGSALPTAASAHGGGLNACGCHVDRKTGECHCHRPRGCGCPCQPAACSGTGPIDAPSLDRTERVAPEEQRRDSDQAAEEVEALAGGCGVERWNVKTMSDPPAKGLHRRKPRRATVEELAARHPPIWRARGPRTAAESKLYEVEGCVTAYAREADSDLHVVLRGKAGATMVVEFPNADNCAPMSHAPGLIKNARDAFLKAMPARPLSTFRYLQPPIPVTVVGPLFMDKVHNQEGVAPNGAEIHPVLRFQQRSGTCN
jgi:hypothetical protein